MATLQDGCIRSDTWDSAQDLDRRRAGPHRGRQRLHFASSKISTTYTTSREVGLALGRFKEARDPETWAVGCPLAADRDAMSRHLGESLASIFPTHLAGLALLVGIGGPGPPRRCRLRPTARLLQPCQRALLWPSGPASPAGIQPPWTNSVTEQMRALTVWSDRIAWLSPFAGALKGGRCRFSSPSCVLPSCPTCPRRRGATTTSLCSRARARCPGLQDGTHHGRPRTCAPVS